MKDTKLIRLLKTFSKEEWKEFEKFAASPYFNNGRNYISLVKELKKFLPGFDSVKLTKENLYKKIFSGKLYKETVINTMLSGLYSLAEEYITQQNIDNDKYYKISRLINGLSRRRMLKETENIIKGCEISFENAPLNSTIYFDKEHIYPEIISHYISYDNDKRIIENLEISSRNDTILYLHKVLQNYNTLLNNKTSMQKPLHNYHIPDILSLIDIEKILNLYNLSEDKHLIVIFINYYYMLCTAYPDKTEYFLKLKELVFKNFEEMNLRLKISCMVRLVSICRYNISGGKEEFHKEFSVIYKIILKYGIYGQALKKYFPNRLFRAIVNTGIYLNEIEWVENFYIEYIGKTDPNMRKFISDNSIAMIEFAKKDYDKALQHAAAIKGKNLYKLDAKNITTKIYYETNSFLQLDSFIDSYKHLIKNLDIKDNNLNEAHCNFIGIVEKLISLKTGNQTYDILKLKEKITNTLIVESKPWLLEKINELAK